MHNIRSGFNKAKKKKKNKFVDDSANLIILDHWLDFDAQIFLTL